MNNNNDSKDEFVFEDELNEVVILYEKNSKLNITKN